MPNIKFNYLYRDGGNYKKYKSIIFYNSIEIDLSALEALIRSKLIFGEWFYVDQWGLPDLHFRTWDNEIDHTFHEFEGVEYTDEPADDSYILIDFIELIKKSNR